MKFVLPLAVVVVVLIGLYPTVVLTIAAVWTALALAFVFVVLASWSIGYVRDRLDDRRFDRALADLLDDEGDS